MACRRARRSPLWTLPANLVVFASGPESTELGRTILRDALGGSLAEQEQRYRDWSPNNYLRPGLPPTLILHGTGDYLVPLSRPGNSTQN